MTYERETLGHVLQALRDWGIPETIAGSVTVGMFTDDTNKRDRVFYGGQLFAEYKYFDGIERPLFRWHQHAIAYSAQRLTRLDDGTLKADFRLSLSPSGRVALVVPGHEATQGLFEFLLRSSVGNIAYMSERGIVCSHSDPTEKFIIVEFWKPETAQAFVDHVNNMYKPVQ